jgi:hypothetical protein
MKKTFILLTLTWFTLASCETKQTPAPAPAPDNTSQKLSEIDRKRMELEEMRSALKNQQELAQLDAEMKALNQEMNQLKGIKTPVATAPVATPSPTTSPSVRPTSRSVSNATIKGTSVIMRSEPSINGAKVENFTSNELVDIIAASRPTNNNEAIIRKNVEFVGNNNRFTLNKGKAVVIDEYDSNFGVYEVSFQHPEYGTMSATLSESEISIISNEVWYKVRRANGQVGWVFGKFVVKN